VACLPRLGIKEAVLQGSLLAELNARCSSANTQGPQLRACCSGANKPSPLSCAPLAHKMAYSLTLQPRTSPDWQHQPSFAILCRHSGVVQHMLAQQGRWFSRVLRRVAHVLAQQGTAARAGTAGSRTCCSNPAELPARSDLLVTRSVPFLLCALAQYHPVQWYKQKEDADEEVTKLRYERYEAVRQVGGGGGPRGKHFKERRCIRKAVPSWARETLVPWKQQRLHPLKQPPAERCQQHAGKPDYLIPAAAMPPPPPPDVAVRACLLAPCTQERLRMLIEERKHLINENWQANADPRAMLRRNDSSSDPRSSSAMVEKERQRLEVLKRRQEKELQQMVQYEITRKVGRAGAQHEARGKGQGQHDPQGGVGSRRRRSRHDLCHNRGPQRRR